MLWYQLLRPIDYLFVKDKSKWKVDWGVPFVVTILTASGFALLSPRPQIFLKDGLLQQVATLLSIMPGFYLAALAAIATFHKPDMDSYMPSPVPTVETLTGGHWRTINLTRRRYLSLMFGYLTLLSLFLFIGVLISNACAESVKMLLPQNYHYFSVVFYMSIFLLFFWHMIAVTLFGLYQLSDRMHQPDITVNEPPLPRATSPRPVAVDD